MIDIQNMSILVVDDMKSMRFIIKKMLRHLGIGRDVYFAENGLEGLKKLRKYPVDLAIVDWQMPVMNGGQLLEAVRKDKNLRDMPILVITGESQRDIVYEVAESEVEGYLIKPLAPAILEQKIRQAVQHANDPGDAVLFSRKAREMDEAGELDLAISFQRKAVDAKPKASRLKRNLGILYGKAKTFDAMEKCFLEAAASNLQDALTRSLLSEFYWDKKQWQRSVRYACEVLLLTNRFNDRALEMGRQLLIIRQNELAVALYSALIKKLQKNLPLKEEILDQCMDNGEFRFARTLLNQLIKEFPANFGLLYKAGIVFDALGEEDKALDNFLTADRRGIDPVNTKLKIADIYCRKNKILLADEVISQILRIEPENETALALRRRI